MLSKIIWFSLSLVFFSSCANKEINTTSNSISTKKKEVRDGQYEVRYDNGNLWSTCEYKNGKKHGKSVSYYPNGKQRYVGFYRDDKQSGQWFFYDSLGNFVKEVNYEKTNE